MSIPEKPSEFPISTINQLIKEKGEENTDDTFLIENQTDETITYGEVHERSDTIAAGLINHGVEKGDVVASLFPDSIDHVLLWFGCMKAGAIWAPLNTGLKSNELVTALDDIEPRMLVIDQRYQERGNSILDQIKYISEFVMRNGGRELAVSSSQNHSSFESLTQAQGDVKRKVSPDDPAVIIFTGGTTGRPKPVLLSQFAPVSVAYRYKEAFSPKEDDRQLSVLRLFHNAGQQVGILGPMMSDISSVIVEKFSASEFFDQVNRHNATFLDAFGGVLGALLNTYEEPVENSARICLGGLDHETHKIVQERFGLDVLHVYSLSEAGGSLLVNSLFEWGEEINSDGEGIRAGSPGNWSEIQIVDKEGGKLNPGPENIGEIVIRPTIPNTMMECYYNRPKATVDTWRNLWLHTGDLGWKDEDGYLYFVGRKSHWIRRMGENITSQEVEKVLNEYPGVTEAGVVGVPNEIGEEDVKAHVKMTSEEDPDELVAWCRERLAEFKVPRYIDFVDFFPRTETKNEIERHTLRERGIGDAWDRES